MKYTNTITQINVGMSTENPIYGEGVQLKLEDECGGIFLILEQSGADDTKHQVRIDLDEWENICDAVSILINQPLVK